jgi:signal transduction histidine kinase
MVKRRKKEVSKLSIVRLIISMAMLLAWSGIALYSRLNDTRETRYNSIFSFGFGTIIFFIICIMIVEHISFLKLTSYRKALRKTSRESNIKSEIIESLFESYDSLFHMNLKTNKVDVICLNPVFSEVESELGRKNVDAEAYINLFAATLVYPEYREEFKERLSVARIKEELQHKKSYTYTFMLPMEGQPKYIEMKAVNSETDENSVYVGFADVDKEVREEMRENYIVVNSMEQAAKANETKDTFLSNISHQLKTPLNAIVAYASLIGLDEEGKERSAEYATDILRETDKMLKAINNLLDMSMIKNGEMLLDEYLSNIKYVVETSVDNLKEKASDYGVDMDFQHEIIHENVFCDGAKLGEICEKIIDNAIVYSNKGSHVNVSLKEYATVAGKAMYEIVIADKGIGMDNSLVNSIFEPFARLDEAEDKGVLGVGLGMTIIKYYVELMNGTIDIYSEKGQGTTVTIKVGFRISP